MLRWQATVWEVGMEASRASRKAHGLAVGEEFDFYGSVANSGTPIRACLHQTSDGGYDVVAAGGGVLASFGPAGKFWAAPLDNGAAA